MGMEIKKAPEADLENKRGTWLLMGYVADCSTMSMAFVVPFVGYIIVWLYARHMMRA